jgi:hypothetical protein
MFDELLNIAFYSLFGIHIILTNLIVLTIFILFLLLLSTKYPLLGIFLKYINKVALVCILLWGIDRAIYSFLELKVQNFQLMKLYTFNAYDKNYLKDISNGILHTKIETLNLGYIESQKDNLVINEKKLNYTDCLKKLELKRFSYEMMYLYGEDEKTGVICEVNSSLKISPFSIEIGMDTRDYNRTLKISNKETK